MINFENEAKKLIGTTFGTIEVIGVSKIRRNSQIQMIVKCTKHPEMGSYEVLKGNLISGNTNGCSKCGIEKGNKGHTSHNMSKSHEYYSFNRILQNVKNPNNNSYKNYGGRGIDIDPRYDPLFENQGKVKAFGNFVSDLKELNIFPIPKGFTLDREDNNKGYWKDNLRLATPEEQQQNTRANVVDGNTVKLIREDYKTGRFTQLQLGKKYNIDKQNIWDIVNYKTWKNIV